MSLGELSYVAGVSPKWVLNGRNVWGAADRYELALAQRLAVTHALQSQLGIPLARAYRLAVDALALERGAPLSPLAADPDATVALQIDLARILAAVAARRSAWSQGYGAKSAGRPVQRRRRRKADALDRAADWGVDLTLLQANAMRSPAARLRQLDRMRDFTQRARARTS